LASDQRGEGQNQSSCSRRFHDDFLSKLKNPLWRV
jgi:hypothetical protein